MASASNIASFEVKVSGTWTPLPIVGNAAVRLARGVVDASEWNLDYAIMLPGVNSTTVNVDAFTDPLSVTYNLLEAAYDNATEIEVRLQILTSTARIYSIKGYVTELAVTASAKDLIRSKFTIQGSDITIIA